ncbi:trans-L-3-hydroxyproline dehydratase isoform X2 [Gouania willdenowi]|uniref:trans-L-3-hydroxyproline dehydratase n=1 Tax=Gouania willdenowi TaxID=441366 RepID=A0A8C5DFL8_GOUWI|nr:trans-3-hydroxy-L-proline dehydratase isoform X2 [Gouania willdenowi]
MRLTYSSDVGRHARRVLRKMAEAKQNWSMLETTLLLNILKECRIGERLDGRKVRNSDLFNQVHEKLTESGVSRSVEQIKNRWKSLKSLFYKAKLSMNTGGAAPISFPFYHLMDEIMEGRPLSGGDDTGLDFEFPEDSLTGTQDNTYDEVHIKSEETEDSSSPQPEDDAWEDNYSEPPAKKITEMQLPPHQGEPLSVVDMHTGGEPLRIILSGYPHVRGDSVLAKRRYVREHLDHFRRVLMFEPRGHSDMYGALIVDSELPEADMAVLFMHNEGYSTMCGHAVIALGRFAVDYKLVKEPQSPETQVNIHCPCGLVKAFVQYSEGKTGGVRFHSVPAFAFATDVTVRIGGFGEVTVDISYGGAFYAFVSAQKFGLDVTKSRTRDLVDAATAVTNAVKSQMKLYHPTSDDLAFLYGTILTDGKDQYSSEPTANVCVFAEAQVDRSPTGSGVTARVALQYHKGLIQLNQTRTFQSGATGSQFTGRAVEETKCGDFNAVVVEVAGQAFYTGVSHFVQESKDKLTHGFLLK